VHHVRAVHGSATNFPGRERRLLLFQYRAAEARPLLGFAGGIGNSSIYCSRRQPNPDAAPVPPPVRLPLPPAEYQGSIYENQQFACRRFWLPNSSFSGPAR
jgi:phytanoyl-CoA hydroxylase